MTWAVVQTEAQREHVVRLMLERNHYETYFPRVASLRIAPPHVASPRFTLHRPATQRIIGLFPGYIFVRLDDRGWSNVRWTLGVIRLLMAGDRPALLSETIVSEIRKRERNGLVRLPQPLKFRKGQAVKIIRGSFEGHLGLYEGQSGKDRERVLLELLGQHVVVDMPARDIALVSTPQIR